MDILKEIADKTEKGKQLEVPAAVQKALANGIPAETSDRLSVI
jgi:hypothetical protein